MEFILLILLIAFKKIAIRSLPHFYKVVFLFTLIILCTTCKKDNTPPTSLPPATQTGANTFGCKINGAVWVPYFPCELSASPCDEMQITTLHYTDSTGLKLSVGMAVGRNNNGKESGFQIGFPANKTGNVYDSLAITYLGEGFNTSSETPYGKRYSAEGTFEIIKLDTINKIVSGTFNFILGNETDSLAVTEGRFDVQLGGVCKCNQ